MLKLTAYSDRISVAPGETIRFMVNCNGPKTYRAEIVRLICGDANPDGPGVKEKVVKTPVNRRYRGRKQVIHAGSHAIVPNHPALGELASFSVQAMIYPTTPGQGRQGLITKWSEQRQTGFALIIDERGSAALCLGVGKGKVDLISVGKPLVSHEWYFVGASYNGETSEVRVYQEPLVEYATVESKGSVRKKIKRNALRRTRAPLIIGGCYERTSKGRPIIKQHYNGKIDRPRLGNRALSRSEMQELMHDPAPERLRPALLGAWDFSLDITSEAVTDTSGNELHGCTVNMPARGVTGFNWMGEELCWRYAPEQWGAIHFHEDDLYDADWEVDFELAVTGRMKSGLYAARLRSGASEEYVPFVVLPKPGREAKLLFILPTGTYMAYGNEHLATDTWETQLIAYRVTELHPHHIFLNEHREYGLCFYDLHSDGSPVCYSSRLRPLLTMRPKCQSVLGGCGSSLWNFNADTHIIDWLETNGYAYDVLTEEDVHAGGVDAIAPYEVVITGTHPEYVSKRVYDAVHEFTQQGGRLINLGGNGFYFRIGYHPAKPGVIECRWDVGPGQTPIGERHTSFTGEPSGLWRRQNRAPQVVTGVGYIAQGFDLSSYYRRKPASFDPRARFIFEGVGKGEKIGDFGLIGGGAAGLEIDAFDRALGSPPHALVLASSEGHRDSYRICVEELGFTYPGTAASENAAVHADMVFYETPNGGGVFSTGSIAWAGSLSHDNYKNNVSRISANVLNRFLDSTPLGPTDQ